LIFSTDRGFGLTPNDVLKRCWSPKLGGISPVIRR